jgi:hypothetical protein
MFYSYKNLPLIVTGNNSGYQFNAESVNININPFRDFFFSIDKKTPSQVSNNQGLSSSFSISYLSEIPHENIFIDNILSPSGNKYFYTLSIGSGVFETGYIKSYTFNVTPNGIIKNDLELIFFSTGSGFNPAFASSLQSNYPSWQLDLNGISKRNVSPAEYFCFSLNENGNEILNSLSGELLNFNFDYKASIDPIYTVDSTYPSRVIYNKEEIDLSVNFDYTNYVILAPNTNYQADITLKNISDSNLQCNLLLDSGFLLQKEYKAKIDDIINNRISLKYFV